ncbi:hypothetical protein ACVW07_000346 [Cellulomonas sp. URHB0016]
MQRGVQLAACDLGRGIVALVRLPGPAVPDDDVAPAVLARRDDALEVLVLERMVLDMDRHPSHVRVERRAARHRPADEHAVDLEAQVVVQPPGTMALDHEPA